MELVSFMKQKLKPSTWMMFKTSNHNKDGNDELGTKI
jgi:hypothetical protein